jgi:hypothetical protein
MTKDEALDLALEALEAHADIGIKSDKAITAIKQARALDKKAENARELGLDYEPVLKDNSNYRYDPPVAEPVAYLCENAVGHKYFRWKKPSSTFKPIALYTTPPAQPAPVQGPYSAPVKEMWPVAPKAAAQPAVPDAIGPDEDELPAYAAGWNDCRQAMLEMMK